MQNKTAKLFVWGLSAIITAAASTIGYFIGPYVGKLANKLVNYTIELIKKGKVSLKKFSASILNSSKITSKIVSSLIKNASKLKYTKTALKHLNSRPYMKSTQTIINIMKSAKPRVDTSLRNGLIWVTKGKYNGKSGTVYNYYSDTGTQILRVSDFLKRINDDGNFITSYKF